MDIVSLYSYYRESSGVSIDSRTINRGDLFFALKGPNFDGHKYVESALKKGAFYAVIQDESFQIKGKTLLVDDAEKALQNLARYHRCMITIPVIGITGSNGKTTTKELMASVLEERYKVFATKGNLNNHLGVPLSVLSIDETHQMAIIEMGANHQKEIQFLSEICQPDYGLITNIGKAHLEGFGGIEGVRKGKTELYEYLSKTNGVIFYHEGDEMLRISLPANTTNIGYNKDKVDVINNYPFVAFKYKKAKFQTQLSGSYNLINAIAALTIGSYFNVSLSDMKKGIESYVPENNRSQLKKTDRNLLIMDAYNANPSSMVESIKNFENHPDENKVLILGHMLEMGESSKEEHEQLIELISSYNWKKVILVGEEFYKVNTVKAYDLYPNTEALCARLEEENFEGYTILLKGSRGVALEQCVAYL